MRTVEVRDRINPQRLLGTMVKQPARRPAARDYQRLVQHPLRYDWTVDDTVSMASIETLTLTFGHRPSDDGWDHVGVYLTDACLKQLATLPDFRLPGESEEQAYMRRRHSW